MDGVQRDGVLFGTQYEALRQLFLYFVGKPLFGYSEITYSVIFHLTALRILFAEKMHKLTISLIIV
jgi:hypothetical protein